MNRRGTWRRYLMMITLDNQQEKPYNIQIQLIGDAEEIVEVMDLIKQALMGYGFHPESIKEYFGDE